MNTYQAPKDLAGLVLPNLLALIPYPARRNRHTDAVTAATTAWMLGLTEFTAPKERACRGLKIGMLAGRSYVDCDADRLRVISDYLAMVFHLDDLTDDEDGQGTKGLVDCVMNVLRCPAVEDPSTLGKIVKSICDRMYSTIGPNCQERFLQTMDMYLQAVYKEADDRTNHTIPKLEEYILSRRDTSGCKPCFVLLEYACDIDLPTEVTEHPCFQELENAANDSVSWQNDIFSFPKEYSKGQLCNLVGVLMDTFRVECPIALELAAALTRSTVTRFESSRSKLPSWGPEVDTMVERYVQGLQDWIIGSALWSFETQRYFGEAAADVKNSLKVPVELL